MPFSDQAARIKGKLELAARCDPACTVFGARSHKYRLGPPISATEVREFEDDYGVSLPRCYRAFVSLVGNGGCSFRDSGAGPSYGIYPFGRELDELADAPRRSLPREPMIRPNLTDSEWVKVCRVMLADDIDLPDDEFDAEVEKLYGGLLPIGSQGCTYLHALVISGEHTGRVVLMDTSGQTPRFAPEANFLDWYERWLDAVIAGVAR